MKSLQAIFEHSKRIVPVIALPELDMAEPLADTLASCGFRVLEITLRTPCALDAIKTLTATRPELTIGAGTLKNRTQMQDAIAAGAHFLVSPGLDIDMIRAAQDQAVPLVPGIMTATEVMQAENEGVGVVKLFPAHLAGGTDFIDAMRPVFPSVQFFPTGGVSEDSVADYLSRDNVLCVGGSWLTPSRLLQQRDWAKLQSVMSRC